MTITVHLDLNIDEQWAAAAATIGSGIRQAVFNAVTEGAAEARKVHQYKDRTGDLTKSIYGRLDKFDPYSAEGTIGATASYASFVENGTRDHDIRPKLGRDEEGPLAPGQHRGRSKIGKPMLVWNGADGAVHFAKRVHHPGTSARPFMGPALHKAERVMERDIAVAIANAAKETD